jgi:integrase
MSVTPHKKCPGVWVLRWYPEGRKKDPKTGKPSNYRESMNFPGTHAEALAHYADLLKTAQKPTLNLAPTLFDAWSDFCAYYKNEVAASTYMDYLATWGRHLLPYFGKLRPAHITPTIIEKYKTMRSEQTTVRGGPPKKKTVTKELCYISSMCSWMARPEINLAKPMSFPIKGYSGNDIKAPLPLIPSRREILLIVRRADKQYRPIFALCYYGGLRKTEAATLRGEKINFAQGYMLVTGKGGKEGIVPIYRKMKVFLRKRFKKGYMFLNPKTEAPYVDFRRALKRAVDRAGVGQHVYLHLLRHSFGTHSIQSGINFRSLQIMMRHSTGQMTEKYTTLAGAFLNEEMDKFGGGALHNSKPAKRKLKSVP